MALAWKAEGGGDVMLTGIVGVGTDIVNVERIRRAVERQGDRFLQQIFTRGELDYCMPLRDPYPSLAARWAAKEAVAKAFGVGMGGVLNFGDIEVVRTDSGQPIIVFSERARAILGDPRCFISLSHEKDFAVAFVIASV